jgi:hypothetical protein
MLSERMLRFRKTTKVRGCALVLYVKYRIASAGTCEREDGSPSQLPNADDLDRCLLGQSGGLRESSSSGD